MEEFSKNTIEQEIMDLSKKIEEKRRVLEEQNGIIEEKELVRSAVAEKVSQAAPQTISTVQPIQTQTKTTSKSYLDVIDEKSATEVNRLIEIVFSKGITAALKEVENEEPFIMDAFHDALIDKMYDELKSRGIVK